MANIFGTLNPKGMVGGGSETSGCYLLQNASSLTHLYAHTYEGNLQDIDNKNDFPLKDGDTLIGDDNYVYKLLGVDTDLGTFTAVQFWKLDATTPTIEIDFSQALSSDTYALDSNQFGLIQNNEVVKVDLYSESELLTFIKKSDDGSNIVMGTIITYDSTNSVYVYKEAVINVSSYEMTITDMTLSSGGGSQLYQHFISVNLYDSNTTSNKFYIAFSVVSSSDEEINAYDKLTALIIDILGTNATRNITNGAIAVSGFVGDNASKQVNYLLVGNNASAWTTDTIWYVYSNGSTIDYGNFPDPVMYTRWHYTVKDIVKPI